MAEVQEGVRLLQQTRDGVIWIERMLPRDELSAILTAATTFVCPSVYEPLGIVNLEAMACGAAVVGTATGGIPEVVADGVTGRLVPIDQVQDGTGTPVDSEKYVADLAAVLTEVAADPEKAKAYGEAGRERAKSEFSWGAIADTTRALYEELTD
jgi:starch synthase